MKRGGGAISMLLSVMLSYGSIALAPSPASSAGFTAAGNLAAARLAHTANLLPDGRVLVAGGGQGPDLIDGWWVVPGAELFDPATATTQSAGTCGRDLHTATLLQSGQLLLTGGETGWCDDCSPFRTPRPLLARSAEL